MQVLSEILLQYIYNHNSLYILYIGYLYKEGIVGDEEMLRYYFRTEVQPGSHRFTDLWPFALKSTMWLLFTGHVSTKLKFSTLSQLLI